MASVVVLVVVVVVVVVVVAVVGIMQYPLGVFKLAETSVCQIRPF